MPTPAKGRYQRSRLFGRVQSLTLSGRGDGTQAANRQSYRQEPTPRHLRAATSNAIDKPAPAASPPFQQVKGHTKTSGKSRVCALFENTNRMLHALITFTLRRPGTFDVRFAQSPESTPKGESPFVMFLGILPVAFCSRLGLLQVLADAFSFLGILFPIAAMAMATRGFSQPKKVKGPYCQAEIPSIFSVKPAPVL